MRITHGGLSSIPRAALGTRIRHNTHQVVSSAVTDGLDPIGSPTEAQWVVLATALHRRACGGQGPKAAKMA